jgi:hypothetical protein
VKFGYDPMSAVATVASGDLSQLKHPGPPLQIMTEVPKGSPPAAVLPGDTQPGSGAVVEKPQLPAGKPINGAKAVAAGGG